MSDELIGHLENVEIDKIIIEDRERTEFGDLEDLADSIKAKGVIQPVILDNHYRLIAGERRIRASIMVGKVKIPALVGASLNSVDRKELELLENFGRKDFTWQEEVRALTKLHEYYVARETEWSIRKTAVRLGKSKSQASDQIILATYLEEIPELRECKYANDAWKAVDKLKEAAVLIEMQKRRDVSHGDTQDLISRAAAFLSETKTERAEEYKSTVVNRRSNYIVRDVFEAMTEMHDAILGPGSIVECDPPYGIDLPDIKKMGETDDYGEIPQDMYPAFLERLCSELYRIQGDQSTLIFWYAHQWYAKVCEALADAGYLFSRVPAVWMKLGSGGQSMQPKHLLASVYEPFILARKGKGVPLGKAGSSNVFMANPVTPKKKIHPTERPVALIKDILQTCCIIAPGINCMVPFAGSGNTLVVCEELGINSYGFDITDIYKLRYEARKDGVEI